MGPTKSVAGVSRVFSGSVLEAARIVFPFEAFEWVTVGDGLLQVSGRPFLGHEGEYPHQQLRWTWS